MTAPATFEYQGRAVILSGYWKENLDVLYKQGYILRHPRSVSNPQGVDRYRVSKSGKLKEPIDN